MSSSGSSSSSSSTKTARMPPPTMYPSIPVAHSPSQSPSSSSPRSPISAPLGGQPLASSSSAGSPSTSKAEPKMSLPSIHEMFPDHLMGMNKPKSSSKYIDHHLHRDMPDVEEDDRFGSEAGRMRSRKGPGVPDQSRYYPSSSSTRSPPHAPSVNTTGHCACCASGHTIPPGSSHPDVKRRYSHSAVVAGPSSPAGPVRQGMYGTRYSHLPPPPHVGASSAFTREPIHGAALDQYRPYPGQSRQHVTRRALGSPGEDDYADGPEGGMYEGHEIGVGPEYGMDVDDVPGNGKKHVCPTCFKRFNRPSSLRIHVNTHTGATPFRCPWPNCGREFNVNSNMRRHYRNHTGGQGGSGPSSSSRSPVPLNPPLQRIGAPATPPDASGNEMNVKRRKVDGEMRGALPPSLGSAGSRQSAPFHGPARGQGHVYSPFPPPPYPDANRTAAYPNAPGAEHPRDRRASSHDQYQYPPFQNRPPHNYPYQGPHSQSHHGGGNANSRSAMPSPPATNESVSEDESSRHPAPSPRSLQHSYHGSSHNRGRECEYENAYPTPSSAGPSLGSRSVKNENSPGYTQQEGADNRDEDDDEEDEEDEEEIDQLAEDSESDDGDDGEYRTRTLYPTTNRTRTLPKRNARRTHPYARTSTSSRSVSPSASPSLSPSLPPTTPSSVHSTVSTTAPRWDAGSKTTQGKCHYTTSTPYAHGLDSKTMAHVSTTLRPAQGFGSR